jgi:dTDP-glucose 4,6-dehydratase
VSAVDSGLTGDPSNLDDALSKDGFELVRSDITTGIEVDGPLDAVIHMASPASPVDYLRLPLETMRAGALGTWTALELAAANRATFLLTSTSEVYGDPEVHPQPESYWGNVNPIGPRAVYDESKRFAEALTMAYHRHRATPIRIARIFNTYGPRLRPDDGRAVPTFLRQAMTGRDITVHGDGTQTRSLCFVDDLIDGLWRLLRSDLTGPVNLGNPEEVTMQALAETIRSILGSTSSIVFDERPEDDPRKRCPDISVAKRELGWSPTVPLSEGIEWTAAWANAAWKL